MTRADVFIPTFTGDVSGLHPDESVVFQMHLLGMTARGRGMPPLNRPVAASSRPGPAPFQLLSAWKVSLLQESVIPADQNRDHGLPGSDAPRGVAVGFVFDPKARCEPACKHAGVCIRNNTCFCAKGYEGETCQYANCFPKCKNGGVCLRPGKCRCPAGFGGRYCHKVTCDGGCWNGGECTAVNGAARCICPSSWTGSKCQHAMCPQGCRNGGVCVAPGICSCPDGWVGGACHTAVCSRSCMNGGKCISPDTCRCRPPFSGPRCSDRKKTH
ncbi:von Willebrand factor D and EGF domain-containing protein [Oryzias melastigma]|uniref:von Willebrand factor D and EGF domain-containing protein n=1 Tax=Oryzias melastigma TaxID=30732 RepID=A0A834F6V3_ORYME|nr:von Willebrand factor D and EGF domain-containing protein [Oryzias melastigma]